MKKPFLMICCLSVFVTLSAQTPSQTKKVWTNDDSVFVHQALKPVTIPASAPTKTATAREPKSVLEMEARIQLRQRWIIDLRAMLEQSREEVLHSVTSEQRAATVARVNLIESDLEDGKGEIQRLEARLADMKAPSELK